ncbi:MAG: hypothetical protein ACI9ME_001212, partial [Ilumatobacter sp.]
QKGGVEAGVETFRQRRVEVGHELTLREWDVQEPSSTLVMPRCRGTAGHCCQL